MTSIAAIGFCCIDSYRNLGLSYPTGNGIDSIAHLSRRGEVRGGQCCGYGRKREANALPIERNGY